MPHLLLKCLMIVFFTKILSLSILLLIIRQGDVFVKNFDQYPKSIKKAVRYIKQDASKEQLEEIRKLIDYAIKRRSLNLE